MSPSKGSRTPERQRATKKLQIYVTPYTVERLEKLQERTGKALSVLVRGFIEEGLGLTARARAASARAARADELSAAWINQRASEIIMEQSVSEAVARRLAIAEHRRAS